MDEDSMRDCGVRHREKERQREEMESGTQGRDTIMRERGGGAEKKPTFSRSQ